MAALYASPCSCQAFTITLLHHASVVMMEIDHNPYCEFYVSDETVLGDHDFQISTRSNQTSSGELYRNVTHDTPSTHLHSVVLLFSKCLWQGERNLFNVWLIS